jgi:hypothetical protein
LLLGHGIGGFERENGYLCGRDPQSGGTAAPLVRSREDVVLVAV